MTKKSQYKCQKCLTSKSVCIQTLLLHSEDSPLPSPNHSVACTFYTNPVMNTHSKKYAIKELIHTPSPNNMVNAYYLYMMPTGFQDEDQIVILNKKISNYDLKWHIRRTKATSTSFGGSWIKSKRHSWKQPGTCTFLCKG